MKTFVHMLAFNTISMIRGGLENYRDTVVDRPDIHRTLFWCGFPLPSRSENHAACLQMALEFGWNFKAIENRGVAKNWEQVVFDHFKPEGDDVVVGFDPDVRMRAKGWLPAMEEILRLDTDNRTVFVAADRPYYEEKWCADQHGHSVREVRVGVEVSEFRELVAWSMGAYRGDWLMSLGEIDAHNKIYGYGEHWMRDRMNERGTRWVVARGHMDDHLPADCPEYLDWKIQSARMKTKLRFEEWIARQ